MIGVDTSVETNSDAAAAVRRGVRQALRDSADRGFAVSQEHVPHGASSFLANSGYPPTENADGSWEWGYSAAYAAAVEDGTIPHTPPIAPLKKWARRVIGDEDAAWGVQKKIAEEGTEEQPFVEPGIESQRSYLEARGISAYVEREL